MDGRTGGHTDIRTYGRMDGTQFYKMFTEEIRAYIHGQTDILFYYYIILDGLLKRKLLQYTVELKCFGKRIWICKKRGKGKNIKVTPDA